VVPSKKPPKKTQNNFFIEKGKVYLFHLVAPDENMLITICIGRVADPISEVSGSKNDFAERNMAIMSHSQPQIPPDTDITGVGKHCLFALAKLNRRQSSPCSGSTTTVVVTGC